MEQKEITIEDRIVERFAMERLLDYVLETMEGLQRREQDEAVQS